MATAKVVQNKGLSYVCHPQNLGGLCRLNHANTVTLLYPVQRGQVERHES